MDNFNTTHSHSTKLYFSKRVIKAFFLFKVINITMATPKYEQQLIRQPVDITFAVSGSRGFLMGSNVSNALTKLTVVEFSFYIGFPVLQIAERE